MFLRIGIILAVCGVLACGHASAQTTQPAPAGWDELVTVLVRGLTEVSDEQAALASIVSDETVIQKIGSNDAESRYRLRQATAGLKLVCLRTYSWPIETFASDLAADVRSHHAMPESLRRQFAVREGAEAKRANVTAQHWIATLLRPGSTDMLAVIVLWEPPPPVTANLLLGAPEPVQIKPPIFVLVKGQKAESGEFRITHLVFGDAPGA